MILTPDQRLRVFVSSTLGELATERGVVRAAVESMRLAPVMFELGARPHPPRALYRAYLEQSHVFVGLYAERYGWVAPGMDISGLEDEYRLSGERPKLVYVREPADAREPRLTALLADIAGEPGVRMRTFSTPEELGGALLDDLGELLGAALSPGEGVGTAAVRPTAAPAPPLDVLPTPTATFVGRTRELADVTDLVVREDVRMVTLTGMGGIGKSRLALEVAHAVRPVFPGGVVLVPLAEVPEAGLVLSSVASALGIRLDTLRPSLDAVADALAERGRVLLVLDNAEQVQDAAGDLAGLVGTCPTVTLLVTSRKRMRLSSEHDYPLQPLPVSQRAQPTGFGAGEAGRAAGSTDDRSALDSDAVRLFLDRARSVRPDLDLAADPAQRAAVVELCRRLEGLPLAVELAAARVRLLPPTALLARLDRRLDLPASGYADLPARQQTLRATLQWSLDLLTPQERDLLAQLSTFVGGAALSAVERVCLVEGDHLEALAALADQSLLQVDVAVPDPPRFTMLETVREYAREVLESAGLVAEVDARHLAWVRELAAHAATALVGSEHADWLERLEMEGANIRVAGSRAYTAGDADALVDVGYHVWLWLWARHHTREARLWLERAVEAPDLEPLTRARVEWVIAGAAVEQGDNELAHRRLDAATAAFTELDDAEGLMLCSFLSASLAPLDGRLEEAATEFDACAERALALANPFVASISASVAGMILAQLGRSDEAEPRLDRALGLAEEIDNAMLRGQALVARGFARLGRGDVAGADDDLRSGAQEAVACRNPEILSFACDGLAAVALAGGAVDETAVLLAGAAEGLRERAGIVPWPVLRPVLAAIADAVRTAGAALAIDGDPSEGVDGVWARGRQLTLDDVGALTRPHAVVE